MKRQQIGRVTSFVNDIPDVGRLACPDVLVRVLPQLSLIL